MILNMLKRDDEIKVILNSISSLNWKKSMKWSDKDLIWDSMAFAKNEILIINDGSIDGTKKILKKYNFINVIELKKNYGKGIAIKIGLQKSIHNETIIYDGDLELHADGITKLMELNRDIGIHSLMGTRFNKISPFKSKFEWGNFMFTSFFNLLCKKL